MPNDAAGLPTLGRVALPAASRRRPATSTQKVSATFSRMQWRHPQAIQPANPGFHHICSTPNRLRSPGMPSCQLVQQIYRHRCRQEPSSRAT